VIRATALRGPSDAVAEGPGSGREQVIPWGIKAKLRSAEALRLRAGGATYEEIARQLGNREASGAWRAIDRALAETRPRVRPWSR
jgi:hypothetical protein